jgi:hypothetical protein
MIGQTISHYKSLEKLGEARLHFRFDGQGGPAPRLVRRSTKCEGGSPISTTGVLL